MIRNEDVCAIIVTRGDVDITAQLESVAHYGEVLVRYPHETVRSGAFRHAAWESQHDMKVLGRYDAAKHTDLPYVYFQDDDVLFHEHDALLAAVNRSPASLISNMYDEWIEGMGYFDLAMVGLGSICPTGLWNDAFERWLEAHPETDDHFLLDADFIFGVLSPWERYDFGHEILDVASAENRLWRQSGQHERKAETIKMARALRRVVLTMLTKNEEANLHRALLSAKGLFDRLLIHDSGSTDHTIDIAKAFCEAEGIPLTWRETEWEGFEPARNALLRDGQGLGEYMLLMDADEELVFPGGKHEWPPLEMDVHVLHYTGPIDYGHPRLIRSNFPVRFVGKKHSALEWEFTARGMDLKSPMIEHHGDFTHGEGDVYDRLRADVEGLSDDINNSREVAHSLFMRGKAREGLSEWALAAGDYERHLEINVDPEEGIPAEMRFYALWRLGVLYVEHLGKFAEGCDCLMTAYFGRQSRVESIRTFAQYLTQIADATPYPENELLFVHRDMYSPQGG